MHFHKEKKEKSQKVKKGRTEYNISLLVLGL